MESLQRRMEGVVLGLPSGSYAQRVQVGRGVPRRCLSMRGWPLPFHARLAARASPGHQRSRSRGGWDGGTGLLFWNPACCTCPVTASLAGRAPGGAGGASHIDRGAEFFKLILTLPLPASLQQAEYLKELEERARGAFAEAAKAA